MIKWSIKKVRSLFTDEAANQGDLSKEINESYLEFIDMACEALWRRDFEGSQIHFKEAFKLETLISDDLLPTLDEFRAINLVAQVMRSDDATEYILNALSHYPKTPVLYFLLAIRYRLREEYTLASGALNVIKFTCSGRHYEISALEVDIRDAELTDLRSNGLIGVSGN